MFKKLTVLALAILFVWGMVAPKADALYGLERFWFAVYDEQGDIIDSGTDDIDILVYDAGTTDKATIYSDDVATSKSQSSAWHPVSSGLAAFYSSATTVDVTVANDSYTVLKSGLTLYEHQIILINDTTLNGLDSVAIGANVPSTGAFTTLAASGAATLSSTLAVASTSTFGGAIRPLTNDVAALGTGTYKWSDLFLARGGVINWNNGAATMTWDGTYLTIAGATLSGGGNQIFWGADGVGINQTWFTDTAGDYMCFMPASKELLLYDCNLQLMDSEELRFGAAQGGDAVIKWDGTYLTITGAGVSGSGSNVFWGSNGTGINHTWFSDTTGDYVWFDASSKIFGLLDIYLQLNKTDTDGDGEGEIWYDDSENVLKFYDGSQVRTVTSG